MTWPEYEAEMRSRASKIARENNDDIFEAHFEEYCPHLFGRELARHPDCENYLTTFFASYDIPEVAAELRECEENGNFTPALEAIVYQMLAAESTQDTAEFATLLSSKHGKRLTDFMHAEKSFMYVREGVASLRELCERSAKYDEQTFEYLLNNNKTGFPAKRILDIFDQQALSTIDYMRDQIEAVPSPTAQKEMLRLFENPAVSTYIRTEKYPEDAIDIITELHKDNTTRATTRFAKNMNQYIDQYRDHLVNACEQVTGGDFREFTHSIPQLADFLEHDVLGRVVFFAHAQNRERLLKIGFEMLEAKFSGIQAAQALLTCWSKGKDYQLAFTNLIERVDNPEWIYERAFENPDGIGPRTLWALPAQYDLERRQAENNT